MTTLDNDDERDIWWCHVQRIPIDSYRQVNDAQGGTK